MQYQNTFDERTDNHTANKKIIQIRFTFKIKINITAIKLLVFLIKKMNFATNDSKLKLINTNAINLIKSNNISTNYDSNLALYKNPIKRSSISVINSGKPNDAQFTSNQPMNQVQAQIAQNVPVQLINNQQNAINNSLLSYSKTSTSHNSLSSVTTKFKSKQSPSKESKIRELLFEDPRYRAKQLKKQRKQDIQKRFNDLNAPSYQLHNKIHQEHKRNFEEDYKVPHCHMTFVFDPNGRLSYWMGKNNIIFC